MMLDHSFVVGPWLRAGKWDDDVDVVIQVCNIKFCSIFWLEVKTNNTGLDFRAAVVPAEWIKINSFHLSNEIWREQSMDLFNAVF